MVAFYSSYKRYFYNPNLNWMSTNVQKIAALHQYLSQDFLGGPRLIKLSTVINFQKGSTFLFVIWLMWIYDNYTTTAWVYAGLHGSYGLCWLIKHYHFPDRRWEVPLTIGGALLSFVLVLGLYWLIPWILISPIFHGPNIEWPPYYLALCITLHTLGVAIMMASDAQKYYTLKYKSGLIMEGFFNRTRNPNYLGEMMIYGSYGLMAWHWLAGLILAWVWLGLFAVNIILKDESLSKKEGWEMYKKRSGILLPKLFRH